MRVPKFVIIDDVKVELAPRELEDSFGMFIPKKLVIQYDPTYPEEVIRRTLMHEIMHAIIHLKNQYTVDQIKAVDDKTLMEELICETVAIEIYRVLRKNKSVQKFLLGE